MRDQDINDLISKSHYYDWLTADRSLCTYIPCGRLHSIRFRFRPVWVRTNDSGLKGVFCAYLCSAYAKENKHFKKETAYNCRKIILGTLGFKLSFPARFTCTCITRLSTFWACNSELNFSSTPLLRNPHAALRYIKKLIFWRLWQRNTCAGTFWRWYANSERKE